MRPAGRQGEDETLTGTKHATLTGSGRELHTRHLPFRIGQQERRRPFARASVAPGQGGVERFEAPETIVDQQKSTKSPTLRSPMVKASGSFGLRL